MCFINFISYLANIWLTVSTNMLRQLQVAIAISMT